MTTLENLVHYQLLIEPDIYFRLYKAYEEKHGRTAAAAAKEVVAKITASGHLPSGG